MTWPRTGRDMHPLCRTRGHRWELRAESVAAVLMGRYDVLCDRCECAGEPHDIGDDRPSERNTLKTAPRRKGQA